MFDVKTEELFLVWKCVWGGGVRLLQTIEQALSWEAVLGGGRVSFP